MGYKVLWMTLSLPSSNLMNSVSLMITDMVMVIGVSVSVMREKKTLKKLEMKTKKKIVVVVVVKVVVVNTTRNCHQAIYKQQQQQQQQQRYLTFPAQGNNLKSSPRQIRCR